MRWGGTDTNNTRILASLIIECQDGASLTSMLTQPRGAQST